ncbi:MAG TPA: hypothetical protein PKN50_07915 [Spirochaetota bacterium]|mgnify:CR=1 FL=1|jgi:hypothetical protein|nr:hypothetical protein [Spirochaetota bacterium]HPV42615.1 hypothetical protein [Spirochaetota bacterium]
MSDFIEFVTLNVNNSNIGQEFSDIINNKETNSISLRLWFKQKGYDITLEECEKLINKRADIAEHLKRDLDVRY